MNKPVRIEQESKSFPTAALASLSSGTSLINFSEIHQAAEYLMGHPIWTHHFASKDLWSRMSKTLLAQHPQLPTKLEGVTRETYREHLAELEGRLGKELTIKRGDGSTAMSPLDGIPSDKPVIVVKT